MFLTTKQNSIEDFLKAVNFITPEGMELKYFIVPKNQDTNILCNNAECMGFEPRKNEQAMEGITDTIVYHKKNFEDIQSVSHDRFNVEEKPADFPITKAVKPTNNTQLMKTSTLYTDTSDENNIQVLESNERFADVMVLNENTVGLPKFSVLHFKRV